MLSVDPEWKQSSGLYTSGLTIPDLPLLILATIKRHTEYSKVSLSIRHLLATVGLINHFASTFEG